MADRREAASGHTPDASMDTAREGVVSRDRERVLLLECRLEQMRSALGEARDDADRARTRLAEASAREADHARRHALIQEELAEARADVTELFRRLERSEALRAEIEGHLFESDAVDDARELTRLRTRAIEEHERGMVSERTLARLRGRVQELLSSREMLLTRIAEWQLLVRQESPEAADLAEFIAELRREIMGLEERSLESEAREAELRERLALAQSTVQGLAEPVVLEAVEVEVAAAEIAESATSDAQVIVEDSATHAEETLAAREAVEPTTAQPLAAAPDEATAEAAADDPAAAALPPRTRTDALVAELEAAQGSALRSELLVRLGRGGDRSAVEAVRPWTEAPEPAVRASAFEALGRLLERDAAALEPQLRTGLADSDPRVRRRVALAAASARGVGLRALLLPLREDPDPQVRRVVREVLRRAPAQTEDPAVDDAGPGDDAPEGDPVRLRAASGAGP